MSDTFYCIYTGREWPVEDRSLEHIVPYALGGTGEFGTHDVSREGNSRLGSVADGKLINHWLIAAHRWRLQLESEKGNVPGIKLSGHVTNDRQSIPAEFEINPDRSVSLRTRPSVESDWANGRFRINCDKDDLPRILDDLAKKASRRRGITLTREDFQQTEVKAQTIEQPQISAELEMGMQDMTLGFVKIALGTGHFVFRERWSRSADADLLRRFLREADLEKRADIPLPGRVWPDSDPHNSPFKQSLRVDRDKHVIVVRNFRPVSFYCLLFGEFDASVRLCEEIWDGPELARGKGLVFVIDSTTRKLQRYDFEEFIARQMMRQGRIVVPDYSSSKQPDVSETTAEEQPPAADSSP